MSERVKAIRITDAYTIDVVREVVDDVGANTYTSVAERLIHERVAQIRAEKLARSQKEQPAAQRAGAA